MLSPLYMAEISPPEVRGSLMALEQFSIVLGVVFGFWTGFLTRSSTWLACINKCFLSLCVTLSPIIRIMENTPCHPACARSFTWSRMFLPSTVPAALSPPWAIR